jgi:hypothetical protein
MDTRRTLTVDPKLFEFSSNTTRKKRAKPEGGGGIKVKAPAAKKKNDSLKKRSILKMIREHQEARYKQLFDQENKKTPVPKPIDAGDFNKEFAEAKLFMENLSQQAEQNQKIKSQTLKRYPAATPQSLLYHPISENIQSIETTAPLTQSSIHIAPPKYGCLKNGSLPTYRTYMNTTQKQRPTMPIPVSSIGGQRQLPPPQQVPFTQPISTQLTQPTSTQNPIAPQWNQTYPTEQDTAARVEQKIKDAMTRVNHIQQTAGKLEELRTKMKPMRKRRKKTIRRTYKIGKSKVLPRVSVLVSNKTIRSNISIKTQELKQVPIHEVKRHLIKHGLIRIGSTAPNDVLRKMYESSLLMCGEVNNHNPDNLLYNFLHDTDQH